MDDLFFDHLNFYCLNFLPFSASDLFILKFIRSYCVLGMIFVKWHYSLLYTKEKLTMCDYSCDQLMSILNTLRVIPLGTVDNNLGPDRLAGPKALDPNYGRQPTTTFVWKS